MTRFITILLLVLIPFLVLGQDFEDLEEESQTTKRIKEKREFLEDPSALTNRGIFVNTFGAMGLSRRGSNERIIPNPRGTLGTNVGFTTEVGIARNFRIGLMFDRAGNMTSTRDSLKIYSLSYGIDFHFRLVNGEGEFYYARLGAGSSSLQVFDIFIATNQDSTLMASQGGNFINLEFGKEKRINAKVNYYYGLKLGMISYPQIVSLNIYDPLKNQTVLIRKGTADEENYRIGYFQALLVFGLSFKL